ncbi:MAG: hypothetical protein ACUVRZ_01305 [Desulfobacca sp.]
MAAKTKISDIIWVALFLLLGLVIIYALYLLVHYWGQSTLQQQLFL